MLSLVGARPPNVQYHECAYFFSVFAQILSVCCFTLHGTDCAVHEITVDIVNTAIGKTALPRTSVSRESIIVADTTRSLSVGKQMYICTTVFF